MNFAQALDQYMVFDPRSEKFAPVEYRRYVLPAWAYFDLSNVQGNVTVPLSGIPTPPVAWKQPYTSANGLDAGFGQPFLVKHLMLADYTTGYADAQYTMVMTELGETRRFMNREIHIRTMFGDGRLPGYVIDPFMFWSQHNIQAVFRYVGSAMTPPECRAYLAGCQFYLWALQDKVGREQLKVVLQKYKNRSKYVWPFWLTTDMPVTLASQFDTADFELTAGEDAQFLAKLICAVSTGEFEWTMTEVKTNQTFSNGAVAMDSSTGDIRLAWLLPETYVVPAGYKLRLTIRNLMNGTNNIYFTVQGSKVYAPMKDVPQLLCDKQTPDDSSRTNSQQRCTNARAQSLLQTGVK